MVRHWKQFSLYLYTNVFVYVFVSDFVFWKHDVLGVVAVVRKCLREMGRDWRQSSRQSTGEVSKQFREKKHSQKEKGKTIKRFEVRCFLSSLISCFWVPEFLSSWRINKFDTVVQKPFSLSAIIFDATLETYLFLCTPLQSFESGGNLMNLSFLWGQILNLLGT